MVKRFTSLERVERENQAQKEYLSDMEDLKESIQEKAWQNRKYRHDLEKHIRTLEAMLSEERENIEDDANDGIRESVIVESTIQRSAIQEIAIQKSEIVNPSMQESATQKSLIKNPAVRYCSDEIVNVVLSMKIRQCRDRQIDFQIRVEEQAYDDVKEIDLVGLLENLLDNAIEAEERLPEQERYISFALWRKEENIFLVVSNRIRPGEHIDFRTTKANPEAHGIGTKIIDEIVSKYHGTKDVRVDPDKNMLEIRVKLERETE